MCQNTKKILLISTFFLLSSCDSSPSQAEIEFAHSVLNDMVPIEGGEYEMGDFIGLLVIDGFVDNLPIHKVKLSDFEISAYLVSWEQYWQYAKFRGIDIKPVIKSKAYEYTVRSLNAPDMPASVIWQDAQDYCHWLGEITGKNIDLPTEAQWEFIARNRGQFPYFPTNNGKYEPGINVHPYGDAVPIGTFPPNPLGIYDLIQYGAEWMFDWYDSEYYQYSKIDNPAGPTIGTYKSARSLRGQSAPFKATTERSAQNLLTAYDPETIEKYQKKGVVEPGYHFRCVIHSAQLEPNDRTLSNNSQPQNREIK